MQTSRIFQPVHKCIEQLTDPGPGARSAPRPHLGEVCVAKGVFKDEEFYGDFGIRLVEYPGWTYAAKCFREVQPPMSLEFINELQQLQTV